MVIKEEARLIAKGDPVIGHMYLLWPYSGGSGTECQVLWGGSIVKNVKPKVKFTFT